MRRLVINFAPPTLTGVIVRTKTITWLFACLGLLTSVGAAFHMLDLTQRQSALQGDLHLVQATLATRTAQQVPPTKRMIPEAQADAVNRAIAQLNLPWGSLFAAVEMATPPTIALLSLEPDAKNHLLKGSAEARTSDDLVTYIDRLKQQALFNSVILTKHEINERDPNKPIRFQFEAQWAGVAP